MRTNAISHKVSDDLYLVEQTVSSGGARIAATPPPTHHVVVVDCSGSMSWDLPKIREQLKKKLPKLLAEKDVISVIWFSGRDQYGVLIEAEPVATLADLSAVNGMIDRWLRPVCLTGFLQPIQEVPKLVERCRKKHPSHAASLFFMSDGHDNCSVRSEVLKAVASAAGGLSAATFVEYGYYADRPLLAAMAEKASGALIFSEDFDRYAPQFEAAIQKRPMGVKRVEVKVDGDPIGGFAYAISGGDLLTFAIEGGKIAVPEGTNTIAYLSPAGIGVVAKDTLAADAKDASKGDKDGGALALAYAAASLFAVRMKSDVVLPVLKSLGDVALIEQFANCFGKQKYSEFMDVTRLAASEPARRWTRGYDPNKVPPEDAFTVLDLLQLLQADDGNRVLMEHPSFKYSAIGRARLDASDQLTAEEQAEIEKLTVQIAAEKKNAKKVAELTAKIAAITASKQPTLKFEADPAPDGYSISSLTFNEDRPNVSILVRKPGTVDVSARVPTELKGKVPEKFPTFVWRNYAIIKDGLVNVEDLPVRVTDTTALTLGKYEAEGILPSDAVDDMGGGVIMFHLRKLPVINRRMVRSVSASKFFCTEYELTKAQAAQKVFNGFSKELLPAKKAEGIAAQYGDAAAIWLKEQGIGDGGFSPKTVQAEATDFYMGKELKVSLKGLSTLPSLKDLREQIKKGKLNAAGKLMKPHFDRVESFLASDVYTKAADKDAVLKAWLEGETKAAKDRARGLIYQIAQTTFCLVVGQVWFSDLATLDDTKMVIDTDEGRLDCSVEMREIRIAI